MPPRPKNRTTKPEATQSNLFVDALRFVALATKDEGSINETHVHLYNGWVTAFNGIIAAGQKITEEIYACPNNKLMIEALSKCGEHLSITQLDQNRLSIKSDKFKAIVPCIDPVLLSAAIPDMPVGVINDELKDGLQAVSVLVDQEPGQRVVTCSILLQKNSCIASNGNMIFEFWHGIDMPTLCIPKAIVEALAKCKKKLCKFGFSNSSVTFYFEDESWLRTQLIAGEWPDLKHILDQKSNAWPLPPDFYKALDAVAGFSDDGLVYFTKDTMHSHKAEGIGATYELAGLPQDLVFSIKQLGFIKPFVKEIDWHVHGSIPMTMFYGSKIRGAIAGRK